MHLELRAEGDLVRARYAASRPLGTHHVFQKPVAWHRHYSFALLMTSILSILHHTEAPGSNNQSHRSRVFWIDRYCL